MLLTQTLTPNEFNPNSFPDIFTLQVVSSLLILYALFGFFNLAKEIANEAREAGREVTNEEREVLLSAIVLLIALIRFFVLIKTSSGGEQQTNIEMEEDISL